MLKHTELLFYALVDTLQTSPAREIVLSLMWGWWVSTFTLMMYFFQSREAGALLGIWVIPWLMITIFMYDEELDRFCGISQ